MEVELEIVINVLLIVFFFPKTPCFLIACKEAADCSNTLHWEIVRVIATVMQMPSALQTFPSL